LVEQPRAKARNERQAESIMNASEEFRIWIIAPNQWSGWINDANDGSPLAQFVVQMLMSMSDICKDEGQRAECVVCGKRLPVNRERGCVPHMLFSFPVYHHPLEVHANIICDRCAGEDLTAKLPRIIEAAWPGTKTKSVFPASKVSKAGRA
jgi:hypothetical protein